MRYGPQPAARVIQLLVAGVRVARRSARRRPAPPRHQAAEPVRVPRRRRGRHLQAARLRHRADVSTKRRRRRRAATVEADHRDAEADADRRDARHARLHGARADPRHAARRPRRSLRARLRRVVAAHRRRGVRARAPRQKLLHKHIYEPVPSLVGDDARLVPAGARGGDRRVPREGRRRAPGERARARRRCARFESPPSTRGPSSARVAWWRDYRAPQPAPNVPSAEVQVIMPGKNTVQSGATPFEPTRVGPDGES